MAFGDFTVVRSTPKYVVGSNILIQEVAVNTPAFEFNTDGTYRGLLVEPAGTNGIRNNTMVGAVVGTPGTLPTNWGETFFGLTSEVVATGTENGVEYIDIRISGTATSTTSKLLAFDSTAQIVASSGQIWTHSLWAKKIAEPNPPSAYNFGFRELTAAGALVAFQVGALALTSSWQRLSRTGVGLNVSSERVQPLLAFTIINGASYDFTIRIGLPQMEQSAVATSVIKTSGSTVTRTADSVTLTGASSLIGQTEGTLYAEAEYKTPMPISVRILEISDGSATKRIVLSTAASNKVEVTITDTTPQASFASSTSNYTSIKVGLGYKLNDIALYVNGLAEGTDTSATIPACNRVDIGQRFDNAFVFNGWIRSVALFPTRLTNSQLESLTTL